MKRIIILFLAGFFACLACTRDKLSQELAYAGAISRICMDWGADKQKVADYMKDYELKYEGSSVMDYFLSDEDKVVIYNFDDNGLCGSVLRVCNAADVSLDSVLDGWEYLGSSLEMDAGTIITSMVDIYVKKDKNMLATTYTVEHDGETYRIFGFASMPLL